MGFDVKSRRFQGITSKSRIVSPKSRTTEISVLNPQITEVFVIITDGWQIICHEYS